MLGGETGKRNVHDSLFSVVSKLPIHIRSLTLDNILSKVSRTIAHAPPHT